MKILKPILKHWKNHKELMFQNLLITKNFFQKCRWMLLNLKDKLPKYSLDIKGVLLRFLIKLIQFLKWSSYFRCSKVRSRSYRESRRKEESRRDWYFWHCWTIRWTIIEEIKDCWWIIHKSCWRRKREYRSSNFDDYWYNEVLEDEDAETHVQMKTAATEYIPVDIEERFEYIIRMK